MRDQKKIVAVTGAEGFLGNNVCRELLSRGYAVRGLIFNRAHALEGLNIEIVIGDVTSPASMDKFIRGADYVINLAGILVMDFPYEALVDVNVNAARYIVESCLKHNVKRMIQVSTIQVYEQSPKDAVLDESRSYVDGSAIDYDRSKADGDREVEKGIEQGLDAVILTPAGMLGPRDFLPSVSGQLLIKYNMKPQAVPASGGYDWVDVRDVATAVVNSIEMGKKGESYLLSGKFYSMVELTDIVAKVLDKKVVKSKIPLWFIQGLLPLITFVSKLTGKPPTFTQARLDSLFINENISHDKARKELGFNPRPLEETLRHTYAWFRSKGYMQ